jgi:hypothetical protein
LKTKGEKYRIRAVEIFFNNYSTGKSTSKVFKGYGKSALTIKLYENFYYDGIYSFKVYYY